MGNYNDHSERTLISESTAETEAIGRALGAQVRRNLVIALKGTLGAGKTTLTRGLVAGLGIDSRVTSPTFTLIHEYTDPHTPNRLYHMDTYRLGDDVPTVLAGAETLGIDELLDDIADEDAAHGAGGVLVLVIEWADRLAPWLPADHLEIRLDYVDTTNDATNDATDRRILHFRAHGACSAATLAHFSIAG